MKLFLSMMLSLALIVGAGFALQAHAQVAGCSSSAGYNANTGQPCNGTTVVPVGCTTAAGFSSTTGQPCNGNTASINGYNGTTIGANGFLNGCTSTSGYSATIGLACNTPVSGYIYTGNGTTINVGGTPIVTTPVTTISPGLPTTGAGNSALPTMLVLIASGLVAFGSVRYIAKKA